MNPINDIAFRQEQNIYYNDEKSLIKKLFGPLATDRNGDGLITEEDFMIGARRLGWGEIGADIARSAFRLFDKNGNGYLDSEDIAYAYHHLNRLYN